MFVSAIEELERAAAAVTVFDDGDSIARVLAVVDRLMASRPRRSARSTRGVRGKPLTTAAWVGGALRGGHVDAVVANTSARTVTLFAEQETELVPALQRLDVHDARGVMQRWAVAAEAVLDETAPGEPEQSLHASRTYGDLSVGPERRAEARGVIAEHCLDHQHDTLGGRHRPHVNIDIDIDRLGDHGDARTLDGFPVDPVTAAQLCCDAAVHRVVMGGSSAILELGRATRVVSASLFTALALRDGGCRFPGCGRMARYTQAHHIWAWEDGGPTKLDNLTSCEYAPCHKGQLQYDRSLWWH
ncbi:MAG: HNH endonuclease signature motif containing protein [Acidimicrobiia bacterium]